MSKRKDKNFWRSAYYNTRTYQQYLSLLVELGISTFEWINLPDTVDPRYMELNLFMSGQVVFFKDDIMGYLCLKAVNNGPLNVYGIPINTVAVGDNGYNVKLDSDNSVIIYNNYIRTNSQVSVELYAQKLANLDNAINVNANAQKTPVVICCDETQRLTMLNLYKEYEGNEPFIFGDKALNVKDVSVLNTGAPYVADKLYILKSQIWNEALTYLGISNVNTQKRERMIVDEVNKTQAGAVACRYSRLMARRYACEQINRMFNLNVQCNFRDGDIDE